GRQAAADVQREPNDGGDFTTGTAHRSRAGNLPPDRRRPERARDRRDAVPQSHNGGREKGTHQHEAEPENTQRTAAVCDASTGERDVIEWEASAKRLANCSTWPTHSGCSRECRESSNSPTSPRGGLRRSPFS